MNRASGEGIGDWGYWRQSYWKGAMVIWGHSHWGSGCLGVTVMSDLILGVMVIRVWGY